MPGPIDSLSALFQKIADLERRLSNTMRPAKVHSVDAAKGTVVLHYDDDEEGNPVLSAEIPWTEQAGFIKTWSPPTVGEQMLMFSPSGELGAHSWAQKGGFSDDNPAPHNKENEFKMTMGGDKYVLHIDASGNVTTTSKGNRTTKFDGKETREFASIQNKAGRIDFNKSGGGLTGVSTA